MTLLLVLSCDGHLHRMPCRGARTVGPIDWGDPAASTRAAQAAAAASGWRPHPKPLGSDLHLCPATAHDEDLEA